MLVENKFIYISLPRCASTAFMASCVKQNLDMKHYNSIYNINNQLVDINNRLINNGYDSENLIDFDGKFAHAHESIRLLKEKFGYYYDVISVRRNKYERFISLWKHVLKKFYEYDLNTFNKLSKFTMDEILSYETSDLRSEETIKDVVEIFIKKNKLNVDKKTKIMLKILITPYSNWHNHDSNIIWFDFNQLDKLEEWVSNKLNMNFKLINLNSSNHFDSKLILNDEFKEKYDSIYLPYDEIKSVKTLF